MGSGKQTKKSRLAAWLTAKTPAVVDGAVRDEIARALAPVSPRYLRELLRESGAPLSPLVEGVRQDSLESLERTLTALASVYESGGAEERKECRRLTMEAKDHARFVLKRTGSEQKVEMIAWMLVWLENPDVFPVWARLRKRARGDGRE